MVEIESILGTICDLVTPHGEMITGYFCKPESNIWFTGRISIADYRRICCRESDSPQKWTFSLSGIVNMNTVYIENAGFGGSTCSVTETEFVAVNIIPFELAIGCNKEEFSIGVERVEARFPELNWFLGENAVSCDWDSSDDGYYPTKLNPFDVVIAFGDMSLRISRTCSICESNVGINYSNINEVTVAFSAPAPIIEAVRQIACVRILFCFLADDYVALPSEIAFPTSTSQVVGDGDYKLADKILWLNDAALNKPQKSEYPFRLRYPAIADCFSEIWNKWYAFWDNPINQPLIELFVQIISYKSLGLNRFLNLCQALEVYSTQYRDMEAKVIRNADKERPENINNENYPDYPTLQHRLMDLLQYHNDVFQFDKAELILKSKSISDVRNYYTHFNPSRKASLERKYGDIQKTAGSFEGLLHFMLLATVYKEIGIPVDKIRTAIFNMDSRFSIPIKQLFAGPKATTSHT